MATFTPRKHGDARAGVPQNGLIMLQTAALANYGGPALVLDDAGRVVAANEAAAPLAGAIGEGRLGPLMALLGHPNPLSLPVGSAIYEVNALPCAGGTLLLGREVALERNLRAALVESRRRYKDLVDISSDFAWEIGADGRFVFVSPRGALGYSADQLVGKLPTQFLVQPAMPGASPFTANVPVEEAEVWMTQADGGQACVLSSSMPIIGEEGEWLGTRGICRDVTQERLRDAALSRANNRERLLSYIVRTIRDEVEPADMLRVAAEATARALSATGCQIFRLLPDGTDFILGAEFGRAGDPRAVLDSFQDSDHYEKSGDGWQVLASISRYRHLINGAVVLWRETGRPDWTDDDRLLIDDVANQVGLANEQIINHERILRLSRTDALTGLFNRRAFFEEIARRFHRLAHERRAAALIYVDLDNFKAVNDVHGHQAGDQVLGVVRDLLQAHTRPTDLVARLGGDEFAIWLDGADDTIASRRCNELLEAATRLAEHSGSPDKPLHMSLGVAVHQGSSNETLDELIGRADKAMYEVKRGGKGDWRLAEPHMGESPAPQ